MLRALQRGTAVVAGRGHRDAQLAVWLRCAKLSSREGSAGCRVGRRGGLAAARADSPGPSRAPIGSRRTNPRSRLALQGGVASTPRGRRRNSGAALGRKYKASWWSLCGRAPARASPRAATPGVPGAAFENAVGLQIPASLHPLACVGEIGFSFQIARVISTVCGFLRHAPASLHLHRD